MNNLFPLCQLYGIRIVDELPRGCPMKADLVMNTIHAVREVAWKHMNPNEPSSEVSDTLLQCDICEKCASSMLGHRTIRRLRGKE